MSGRMFRAGVAVLLIAGGGLAGGCYRPWRPEDPLAEERRRMVYPSDPPERGAFLAFRPDGVIVEQLLDQPPDQLGRPDPDSTWGPTGAGSPPFRPDAGAGVAPEGKPGVVIQPLPSPIPPTTRPDQPGLYNPR